MNTNMDVFLECGNGSKAGMGGSTLLDALDCSHGGFLPKSKKMAVLCNRSFDCHSH